MLGSMKCMPLKTFHPPHYSAAPQNISVSASTPTCALVRWSDRILVREEEVEAAEGQDDVLEHVVQLQPFTTYEFVVAAATAAGQGPFSHPSSVRMPQDGELEARGSVHEW